MIMILSPYISQPEQTQWCHISVCLKYSFIKHKSQTESQLGMIKNWNTVLGSSSLLDVQYHHQQNETKQNKAEIHIFIFSHTLKYLSGHLNYFPMLCLEIKPLSSMAPAWWRLTSLNTYYLFNVPYHAISEHWIKSDQLAGDNLFKELGMSPYQWKTHQRMEDVSWKIHKYTCSCAFF